MVSVHNSFCPHCEKEVWWNNGDESDLTVSDVIALKCPWCFKAFWLTEEDREEGSPEDYAEDGHKAPNEAAGL